MSNTCASTVYRAAVDRWRQGSRESPEIVRRSPQDIWKYSDDPIIAWVYFHKNGHVAGIYYYDKHTGLQMGL